MVRADAGSGSGSEEEAEEMSSEYESDQEGDSADDLTSSSPSTEEKEEDDDDDDDDDEKQDSEKAAKPAPKESSSGSDNAVVARLMAKAGPLPLLAWILIGFVVVLGIVLAIVLTLPEAVTCDEELAKDYYQVLVDAPVLDKTEPNFVCVHYAEQKVKLTGDNFFVYEGEQFTFSYDGSERDAEKGDCAEFVVPEDQGGERPLRGREAEVCKEFEFTIPKTTTRDAPYLPALEVTGPTPIDDCATESKEIIIELPAPTVTSTVAPVVCRGQAHTVIATGRNFFRVGATLPRVILTDALRYPGGASRSTGVIADPDPFALAAGSDYVLEGSITGVSPPPEGVSIVSGSVFNISLTAANITALEIGSNRTILAKSPGQGQDFFYSLHNLEVVNPPTAACVGKEPHNNQILVIDGTGITGVEPPNICNSTAVDTQVTIHGSGFVWINGTGPVVEIDGQIRPIDEKIACTQVAMDQWNVEVCGSLNVTVPLATIQGGVRPLPVSITVPQPMTSSCGFTSSAVLSITGPPIYSNSTPQALCQDTGGNLTIYGANFAPTTQVSLVRDPDNAIFSSQSQIQFVSTTEIVATFAQVPSGFYRIDLDNGAGCQSRTPNTEVHVQPIVLPFFLDPPVVYNGITLSVTLFSTGLLDSAERIVLTGPAGQTITYAEAGSPLAAQNPTWPTFFDNGVFNRPQFNIAQGTPAGNWDVEVISQIGCIGRANDVLFVQGNATLTLLTVTPANGWTSEASSITLDATAGLVATPRVYLTPENNTAGQAGFTLPGVNFVSASQLTAVIPSGIPVGDYKLVVVNPTREVGVLEKTVGFFRVQATPLPEITNIAPRLFIGAPLAFTVTGTNFDNETGVTMSMDCLNVAAGTRYVTQIAAGVPTAGSAFNVVSDSEISVTVNTGAPVPAEIAGCIITVTNLNTDASTSFSSIAARGNQNPGAASSIASSVTLQHPRRKPVGLSGRVSSASRFLHVIGGDNGTAATALATVETASVTSTASLTTFVTQRNSLPEPRTFAGGVTIGQYLYVVGGANASNTAADTVWRAQILKPEQTPTMDINIELKTGPQGAAIPTNYTSGLWYFRASALFNSSNANNPNGESLAGEFLTVQLPSLSNLVLQLSWNRVPGASGYRIYRTAAANGNGADVQLYKELSGEFTTSFNDEGNDVVNPSVTPMPVGSTGPWSLVATLAAPRVAHATQLAPHPSDPTKWFIFAIGGDDQVRDVQTAVASCRQDYEAIEITVTPGATLVDSEQQAVNALGVLSQNNAGGERICYQDTIIFTADDTTRSGTLSGRQSIVYVMGNVAGASQEILVGVVRADGTFANDYGGTFTPGLVEGGRTLGRQYSCVVAAAQSSGVLFGIAYGGTSFGNPSEPLTQTQGLSSAARVDIKTSALPILIDDDISGTAAGGGTAPPGTHGGYMACVQEFGFTFFLGGYNRAPQITSGVGYVAG